jgi:hypothetical protein
MSYYTHLDILHHCSNSSVKVQPEIHKEFTLNLYFNFGTNSLINADFHNFGGGQADLID